MPVPLPRIAQQARKTSDGSSAPMDTDGILHFTCTHHLRLAVPFGVLPLDRL